MSRITGLDRLTVHYLDYSGSEPSILLLHPNRSNSHVWDFMVAHSSSQNRFVAVDQRGHGASGWPTTGYGLDEHLADAVQVIESICRGPAVVVGGAAGATTALLLASQRPDLVLAVTAIDPGLSIPQRTVEQVRTQIEESIHVSRDDAAAALPFADRWPEDVKEHYLRHAFIQNEDGRWVPHYSPVGASELAASLASDVWTQIAVSCPTLLVRGEHSSIFLRDALVRLADLIPRSIIVEIPDGGHYPMQDQPGLVSAHFSAFLEAVQ